MVKLMLSGNTLPTSGGEEVSEGRVILNELLSGASHPAKEARPHRATPALLETLLRGVQAWNQWRRDNPEARPEFRGAKLGQATLRGADLSRAILVGADLAGADLSGANLIGVNLIGADLSGANLKGATIKDAFLFEADLCGANLAGADLSGADLSEANLDSANLGAADLGEAFLWKAELRGARLTEANFRKASVGATSFALADLRTVKGLATVTHYFPSFVSTRTLQLSQGQIPADFLKGCGLEDWEIASVELYNPNLSTADVTDLQYEVFRLRTTKPIMINNLFISYSHDDSAFVNELGNRLDKAGIRFWRDTHDSTAGRLETQIDRAMRLHPVVLLVLSELSVNKPWVEWEATRAQELERELRERGTPKDVLLPVALDDAWKTCHWPGWLRHQLEQYNVLGFEDWEDPAVMERQFRRVLAGLPLYGPKDGSGIR